MGSLFSFVMFLMVCGFAYLKVGLWITKKGVDIASATYDSYFDDEYEFSSKDGLNFAMAFTAYDDVEEPILDPSYGKIVFNSYSWGQSEETQSGRIRIESHACTREELGLDDEKSGKFYPIRESIRNRVELYWQKFMCINEADMFIHGSYNSKTARPMNI